MQTIFRLCVLAFIFLVECTAVFDVRIHTPIGMFKVGKQIGEGSYGKVKRGVYMNTEMDVAIKIESKDKEMRKNQSNLAIEKNCYDDMGVQLGFPQIIYFGDHEDGDEKIMIMEMLGPNLDKIFIAADLNFSLERVRWIAKQVIDRIETLHKSGWVYVDMKPENFAIGKYDTWLIYMFDFGLCQKYLDENGEHVQPKKSTRYGPGTVEFMSIRAHKTQRLSRRDDIEGIGYLVLYFLQGTLPWSDDLDSNDYQATSDVVQQKKIDFRVESLGGHAARLVTFFKYTWELEFDTEPDYKYLRKLLDDVLS